MSISPEKLDDIRRRLDVVQVIGTYVQLKKAGQRYKGVCPFHNEKTPSFSVAPDKGLYYCFGCHAGGDVFSFVMKIEGLDFGEAVRKLARTAGVELEPEAPEKREQRRAQSEIGQVNGYALAFFEHALWEKGGEAARAYLNDRRIPQMVAKDWRLGFGGRPGELRKYLAAKNVKDEVIQRAGLLSDDGKRGLFDGRLIFPILQGSAAAQSTDHVVGFGGRRLGDDGPKYVNSRESPAFEKRRLLFGWNRAEPEVRRSRKVVLVEGYMDVIACHMAGVVEAVAALGTAFTEEHSKVVSRLAKEAFLLFDADAAGQGASREAAERLLAAKVKTLVVPLPAGEDPDSLVRQSGGPALVAALEQAEPVLEHLMKVTIGKEGQSIEDKAAAARSLSPLLIALGAGLERDLYMSKLADKVGVTVEQLKHDLFRTAPKPKTRRPEPAAAPGATGSGQAAGAQGKPPVAEAPLRPRKQELEWLKALLLYPELRPRFSELSEYATAPMRLLLDDLANVERVLEEVLDQHLGDERVRRWLVPREVFAGLPPEELEAAQRQTFEDVLRRFKAQTLDADDRALLEKIRQAEAHGEDPEELLRRHGSLTRTKRQLKRPRSNG